MKKDLPWVAKSGSQSNCGHSKVIRDQLSLVLFPASTITSGGGPESQVYDQFNSPYLPIVGQM